MAHAKNNITEYVLSTNRSFLKQLLFTGLLCLALIVYAQRACAGDQTTEIHVTLQDKFSTNINFSNLNQSLNSDNFVIKNNAVALGGYLLRANRGDTFAQMQAYTNDEIRQTFTSQVPQRLGINDISQYEGVVVLDIEHPIHLRDLHEHLYNDEHFQAVIHEFTRRIAIAREAMPNAKLSLYGVAYPQVGPNAWENSVLSSLMAGFYGLYDDLDMVTPVLYTKFGPDDDIDHIKAAGILAERSAQFKGVLNLYFGRQNPKEIYPMLSYNVKNGRSDNRGEISDTAYIKETVRVLREHNISQIGIWSNVDTVDPQHSPMPIPEFMLNNFSGTSDIGNNHNQNTHIPSKLDTLAR